ncbi:MAG: 5'-nucleotidase C-terminal domain-containing protein [Bacillota bacterium]
MGKLSRKYSVLLAIILTLVLAVSSVGFAAEPETKAITVLVTSDLHGHIYPHDYATDSEDPSSGFAKLYTLIKQEREKNPNTILLDNGDTVQDNSADLFNHLPVHPMVQAMNFMGYDTWTIGNHEFNFKKDFLEKNIAGFDKAVLAANVYKADGTRFVKPYEIIVKDGVRVAVVGLMPPHVPQWEASSPSHFEGLTFTQPIDEAKKVVKELEGKYDVLVGAFHLGFEGEYGSQGADAIAEALPEFSVIFLGHAHAKFHDKEVNGVKFIEPGAYGSALAKADIKVQKDGDAWKVVEVTPANIETKTAAADQEILDKFKFVHEESLADANKVVGKISANFIERPDYITGADAITTMPTAQLEDTAVIDLINDVQMHYADAEISSAALFNFGSNLKQGDFKKKDVAYIYKYPNTLVGTKITGENLKKYMEWSASYYNTYKDGDVTISFNPEIRGYNYDMFSGVTYDIDVSQPAGSRIKNLMFNGKPIEDNTVYKLAVNNYRFGTLLSLKLVTAEDKYYDSYAIMQDAGRIRDLIIKYTQEVKNGVLTPAVDNNWKIIGANLEHPQKETIFEMVRKGELKIPTSEDGRTLNVKALNVKELNLEDKQDAQEPVVMPVPVQEAVKTPVETSEKLSGFGEYVVQVNDVLWKIAKKFNTTWEELQKINGLKNPNMLIPGQKLLVPQN